MLVIHGKCRIIITIILDFYLLSIVPLLFKGFRTKTKATGPIKGYGCLTVILLILLLIFGISQVTAIERL